VQYVIASFAILIPLLPPPPVARLLPFRKFRIKFNVVISAPDVTYNS